MVGSEDLRSARTSEHAADVAGRVYQIAPEAHEVGRIRRRNTSPLPSGNSDDNDMQNLTRRSETWHGDNDSAGSNKAATLSLRRPMVWVVEDENGQRFRFKLCEEQTSLYRPSLLLWPAGFVVVAAFVLQKCLL